MLLLLLEILLKLSMSVFIVHIFCSVYFTGVNAVDDNIIDNCVFICCCYHVVTMSLYISSIVDHIMFSDI